MSDLADIEHALHVLAATIQPFDKPYSDSELGVVGCVVEGQIANARGLFAIASAINNLADAMIEARKETQP